MRMRAPQRWWAQVRSLALPASNAGMNHQMTTVATAQPRPPASLRGVVRDGEEGVNARDHGPDPKHSFRPKIYPSRDRHEVPGTPLAIWLSEYNPVAITYNAIVK
jgi:hypothetical protein